MFEIAEVGRKISRAEYEKIEPRLHTDLLVAQRKLLESDVPVILVVSGVEGAGKAAVVNRLSEWFDTRGIETTAFWDESDEERERPRFWRFWRALPPRGKIGILFGSWYTKPIIERAFRKSRTAEFDAELQHIATFEQLLADDGALIVKFWYHLSQKLQKKVLRASDSGAKLLTSPELGKFSKRYERFAKISERAIRLTDTAAARWHLIEAEDARYRDLTTGQILLDALRSRLEPSLTSSSAKKRSSPVTAETVKGAGTAPPRARIHLPGASRSVLDQVDLKAHLGDGKYEREARKLHARLSALAWEVRRKQRHVVAVFEGWDASGKGGAIRRVTRAMDARLYRVISIAAPTDEEKAHHYLWRFWRHIPRSGHVTIFDRSWYGRVLVERVEGFASQDTWKRAYHEINHFEQQLSEHGVILVKFWLHISKDEQLRRFHERESTPWKQHKICKDDWRNRAKWEAYRDAVNEMVARTSTDYAPWTLVPGNDKHFARIHVLKSLCEAIEPHV